MEGVAPGASLRVLPITNHDEKRERIMNSIIMMNRKKKLVMKLRQLQATEQAASLNIREKVIADPTLHFLAMNRASRQYHPREMAVAGPQHPRLYHPLVHNTRQHLANTPPALYPAQYKQQMDCHPKVRPNISQAAQYQQQRDLHAPLVPNISQATQYQQHTNLHPPVQPNISQAAQYKQQTDLHPPARPNTSQAAQYKQQMTLHPSARPIISQAAQYQQRTGLHAPIQPNISQVAQYQQQIGLHAKVRPNTSQVAQHQGASVTLPHSYDTQQPHPTPGRHHFGNSNATNQSRAKIQGLLERGDTDSNERFRERRRAYLLETLYRGANMKLLSSAAVDNGSLGREDAGYGLDSYRSHRGQNEVLYPVTTTKPGLAPNNSYSHSSQVDRSVLYETSRDVSSRSVHSPRREHSESRDEPRVGNPTHQFPAQITRDNGSSNICGGYAVDHDSLPKIVAVHSAGVYNKNDVSTPRSAIRCTQQETLQDSSDDIIITKVSFQGREASISVPVKRRSPVHVASPSKKLCTEERRSSPQIDRPPDAQASGTSQSIQMEGPGKVRHGTFQQSKHCELVVYGSTEDRQTMGKTHFSSQPQVATDDASIEVCANKQPPLCVPNGYLNVQDFFEIHTHRASTKAQETSTVSTVADIELEFGRPPPYLPLREQCGEMVHNVCRSRPSAASPKRNNEDGSSFTSNSKESGATRDKSDRNASQDQATSQKPKDTASSEITERSSETHNSIEDHLENARGKNDDVPVSAKLPKKSYTLELLCSKILQTRERIKNEDIDWKRNMLYRLEEVFIKKLLRMEGETGKKADIDIPREDTPKKKAKRRSSRVNSGKKQLCNVGRAKTKNLSNATNEKEEENQETPVDRNVKQVENCSNAKRHMGCTTDHPEITRMNKNQEKIDVPCRKSVITRKHTDVDNQPDMTSHKEIAVLGEIRAENDCRRTISSDKSIGVKSDVIKPCLFEKHEEAMKQGVADQRGTANKSEDDSTESAASLTCPDSCSLEEKLKHEYAHEDTLPLSKAKSNPSCDRNIWSVLKTFSD